MRISPTQVETYFRCPLEWFDRYVQRLPEPPRPATADLGTRVHRAAAAYCQGHDQRVADFGTDAADIVMRAAIAGVIVPGATAVEADLGPLELIPGVFLSGRADAIYDSPSIGSVLQVHDHKLYSQSGRDRLCRAEPGHPRFIGRDPATLCYAVLAARPGEPVVVRHNQLPAPDVTSGPRVVSALVSSQKLDQFRMQLGVIAMKMQDMMAKPNPPPAGIYPSEPCWTCDFRGLCGGTETEAQFRRRCAAPAASTGDPFA